jgi:hypothetical protein
MYVRFVNATRSENAYLATGLFMATRWLRDDGVLDPQEVEFLDETLEWFNEHMRCPPFKEKLKTKAWSTEAVAWYHDHATRHIEKMWNFVSILKRHGEPVRMVKTKRPGKVIYSDQHQIVAETPRRAFRRRPEWRL